MRRAYHDSLARSLLVRRGLGHVTFVAFIVLIFGATANYSGWGPDYSPRHQLLEWTFFAAATYLFITYRVARIAERRRVLRAILVQGVLLITSLAVFIAYHVHHAAGPQPRDSSWDVSVTPFHEQLAVPAFLALVMAPVIMALALRTERTDVRPLA